MSQRLEPLQIPGTTLLPQPEGKEKVTFSFGRNWRDFVTRSLSPARERQAIESIVDFLELPDLQGPTFLDIGCGSGLFSLAAYRLGARSIISFDADPFSVACCEHMRLKAGRPENWTVLQGSVLNREFLASLQPADIVYAWGSLHHTGDMWSAIGNAARLVTPGGLFLVSIYNCVEGRGGSAFWVKAKRLYNRTSEPGKRLLEAAYVLRYTVLPDILRFKSPLKTIRSYGQDRGMDFMVDVRDWLGGYPYEYATADAVFSFCKRELGFELRNLRTTNTLGTNQFLFRSLARR